jgi:hypothetical protein
LVKPRIAWLPPGYHRFGFQILSGKGGAGRLNFNKHRA